MTHVRNISSALRILGVWLLTVCVIAGAAGLGASWAFADGSKPCGAACPCDAVEHEQQGTTHAEHAESDPCADEWDALADHDAGGPCEDQCPEDCPNCGCGLGVAAALMAMSVPSTTLGSSSLRLFTPLEAPASGNGNGVFRPPRS